MSTIYDFTYTLNSETTQNEVLDNIITETTRKEYEPISHFFVDESKLTNTVSANYTTDAYGPVTGSLTTKYRTTSKVRATDTNPIKVLAICKGQVIIQPQTGSTTKVNLILKPETSYAPLKIKYFIYRGINKTDLIDNDKLKPTGDDINQPQFLKKIWSQFIAYNTSLKNPSTGENLPPPNEFPAVLIGYDENQADNTPIENYFTKKDVSISYQIPSCEMGEHLGNFTGEIGLDVVLDHGDYQLTNQDELFKLDLKFAREKEHIFDTATIPSSSPIKVKRYKEYIHQFMDAAAFWGSHMECGVIKTIATEAANVPAIKNGLKKNNDIFTKILSKYQTKNKIYVYIQGENNKSYNYYDATRKVYGFSTTGQLNNTSDWPIIIEELTVPISNPPKYKKKIAFNLEYSIHVCDGTFAVDTSITPNKHIANVIIPEYERHLSIDVISPKNDTSLYPMIEKPVSQMGFVSEQMQFEIPDNSTISGTLPSGLAHQLKPGYIYGTPTVAGLSSVKVTSNSKVQNINFIINSTSAPLIQYLNGKTKQIEIIFQVNGTKSCASFLMMYCNLKQEFPLKNYYNDLFPVNLTTTFKLPTTGTENLSSWTTYDKSRMVNLDDTLDVAASIQNKVVFDNGKGKTISGVVPRKERRLYMAMLKRNSKNIDELNIQTITSGISKTTTTGEQYALNLYNDQDFSVYKGTFDDGGTIIDSLALVHSNNLNKKNSFFHLGITNEEYNKLIYGQSTIPIVTPPAIVPQFLPSDADNVYFHLEEISTFTTQNVQKFKVGMRFEDNTGAIITLFPLSPNDVYVYTIDGNYFFSKDYSEFQEFFEEYPKAKADFRLKLPYAGEFGFDWMRVGDTLAPRDIDYKNHVGKLYKNASHTIIEDDINKDNGNFNKIPKMYKKLELEYKPFPIQWEVNNNVDKYYVPILTIYPPYIPVIAPGIDLDRQPIFASPYKDDLNRIAKLTLNLKIDVAPTKIEFVYDQTLLEVTSSTNPIVIPTSLGNNTLDISVKCLREIGVEQQIKVVAYYGTNGKPKTIGLLRVNPNVKSKRFSKKVVLITVKTNLNGTNRVPVANDKALFLKQFLRQILITPVIESVELDMTIGPASVTLNSTYKHFDNISHPLNPQNVLVTNNSGISNFRPLYDFLLSQNVPGTTTPISTFYNGHYILFFFSDDGGSLDASGVYHGLNGLSQPTKNTMIVFASANDATATHEFIHTANLPHSFSAYEASKFAKFTYEPYSTDNILDYSHKININRVSLWDWQGKIARQVSQIEP